MGEWPGVTNKEGKGEEEKKGKYPMGASGYK